MIDVNYKYNDNNSDTVIVFLHGWGLNGDSFNGIISKLEKNHKLIKIKKILRSERHTQNGIETFRPEFSRNFWNGPDRKSVV